jgi:hypothetical protein
MQDFSAHNFAARYWRSSGASVDTEDVIPGPLNKPLQRVLGKLNAFARFEGAKGTTLAPGAQARFSVVVAQPSTLNSAIAFLSRAGKPELRADWTRTPPGKILMWRTGGLRSVAGEILGMGQDCWQLSLLVENTTQRSVHITPCFYVTRGVENAGLQVGLYAGCMTFELCRPGRHTAGTERATPRIAAL